MDYPFFQASFPYYYPTIFMNYPCVNPNTQSLGIQSEKKQQKFQKKICKRQDQNGDTDQGNEKAINNSKKPKSPNFEKRKKHQDEQYLIRNQKTNRNIKSNILKHFLKYLQEKDKIAELIGIIQNHWKDKISPDQFFKLLKLKFKNNKAYVKPVFIREICYGLNCYPNFSRLFRILFRRFLKAQFVIRILNMSKIDYSMKLIEIKQSQKLFEHILKE